MRIMYDNKNKIEYILGENFSCELCSGIMECEDCNEYENYKKYRGCNKVYYTGDIGSSFISILSIDIDDFIDDIEKNGKAYYMKYENFSDWVKHFKKIQLQLGDMWNVFLLTNMLQSYFRVFVRRYTTNDDDCPYNQIYDTPRRNLMHDEFIVFKCIKEYINNCLNNENYYNYEKYLFADRFFFTTDEILQPDDDIYIKYHIPYGKEIVYIDNEKQFIDELDKAYNISLKNTVNLHNCDEIYSDVYDFETFSRISMKKIMELGYKFKRCANCGMPFIPYGRSDAIYCDRPAPQDYTKTCKQYGAIKTYQYNLKNNEAMKLYRNIYMQKQMLSKRNPDIYSYQIDFENYKRQSKQWKSDVKSGLKTEEEYLDWLKSVRKRGSKNGQHNETE